jgi:hypothetical protein
MAKEATAHVQIPDFKAPRKDRNGSRYARYIVTEPISHIPKNAAGKEPPAPPRDVKSSHIVSLDSTVHKGAFYTDFVWIWSGSLVMAPETHAHDWDEMIGFIALPESPEEPREIDPGVSLKIGNDIYRLKKSSLVYVPKHIPHAPIYFKDIKKPVLCFTIGTTPKWTQTKNKD